MVKPKSVLQTIISNVRSGDVREIEETLKKGYYKVVSPPGTNVYDREWDVLIILDACRVDLMEEVSGEYDFIDGVESYVSPATNTWTWMQRTFAQNYADEVSSTIYVTSNAFTSELLDHDTFLEVDEVWRYAWDDSRGTVPAKAVTDRAIHFGRNRDFDRMIVHYLQPHIPFVGADSYSELSLDRFGDQQLDDTWNKLENGNLSRNDFWKMYRQNLEYVLDSVEVLLNNLDSESVVLSSDHGNSLGEYGVYSHPGNYRIPPLYSVPWVRTSAIDKGTYDTNICSNNTDVAQKDVENQLQSLGYL